MQQTRHVSDCSGACCTIHRYLLVDCLQVKDNWKNLEWEKIKFMVQKFGLTPWYMDKFTY